MFPLSSPSSILTALHYLPPQYPYICFSSSSPSSSCPPFLPYVEPPPPFSLEIVICKALCLDSPYLCRGVVASLSLSSFLSVLHEVLAQTGTFSSYMEKNNNKTMRTTLKQQNLSPKNSAFPTLSQFSSQD